MGGVKNHVGPPVPNNVGTPLTRKPHCQPPTLGLGEELRGAVSLGPLMVLYSSK